MSCILFLFLFLFRPPKLIKNKRPNPGYTQNSEKVMAG